MHITADEARNIAKHRPKNEFETKMEYIRERIDSKIRDKAMSETYIVRILFGDVSKTRMRQVQNAIMEHYENMGFAISVGEATDVINGGEYLTFIISWAEE